MPYKAIFLFFIISLSNISYALPAGFSYLREVDSSIEQDMRYAGRHNFVGRPIAGYQAAECILTTRAAKAMAALQQTLLAQGLSLKVYDCYRPTAAVADFAAWSEDPNAHEMQAEFYPRVPKSEVFALGYVALQSGHSRGSTVDLTLIPLKTRFSADKKLQTLDCAASFSERLHDNSLDMGTNFDCFDERSHVFSQLNSTEAKHNRLRLRKYLQQAGFQPYDKEWWHFTLRDEPYPNTYFNFPVTSS